MSSSDSRCIHHLLEPAASAHADRWAVTFEEEALNYRDLHRQANQLAHYLRARGVGPDVVVGLYMSRCMEQMVGLLGVLKAGGAYVPLDPQYPRDRLDHMVRDSGASWLLVPEVPGSELGKTGGREIPFARHKDDRLWANESTRAPEVPGLTPRNLAHVLYTSGSTGRPKGVEVEHASVVNFLESMEEILGFQESEVLVSVTGLTFDIAGLDIYLTWMKGARQVLVPRRVVLDGALLRAALEGHGATFLQTTPVTWRGLLDAGWKAPAGFKGICGGEMLPRPLLDDFARQDCALWNMYGPTETTIWSTACALTPAEYAARGRISVGRPIAQTTIHLLDDGLAPVAAGGVGEVCIGGAGLARGYRGQPELTAARFVSGPGGERVYRTGDLGALRANGELELLGRADHQLKFHGYRIEPGEIEFAIREVAQVAESLVVLQVVGGEPALVAYLVAPPGSAPNLREELGTRLPAYMVPEHVVYLASFPQTPNGKVDRQALPPVQA